jgi:segregation and condensation protein B
MSHLAELEVLLFVAGEDGLTTREMAEILHLQPSALLQQLEKLVEKYQSDKDSGLDLVETSNRYKLVTKKDYADLLRTYSKTPINQSMSRALLESNPSLVSRLMISVGSTPVEPSVSCKLLI